MLALSTHNYLLIPEYFFILNCLVVHIGLCTELHDGLTEYRCKLDRDAAVYKCFQLDSLTLF